MHYTLNPLVIALSYTQQYIDTSEHTEGKVEQSVSSKETLTCGGGLELKSKSDWNVATLSCHKAVKPNSRLLLLHQHQHHI